MYRDIPKKEVIKERNAKLKKLKKISGSKRKEKMRKKLSNNMYYVITDDDLEDFADFVKEEYNLNIYTLKKAQLLLKWKKFCDLEKGYYKLI